MWRRYRAVGRFEYNGGQVRAATVDFCQVRQPQWMSHLRHAAVDALYFAKIREDSCLTSPTSRGGPASNSTRTFEEESFASIPAKLWGEGEQLPHLHPRFRRFLVTNAAAASSVLFRQNRVQA